MYTYSPKQKSLFLELIDAAKSGNVKDMQRTIKNGGNVNWEDRDEYNEPHRLPGATVLHYAAYSGKTNVIDFLLNLNKGMDINVYCHSLWTPLHYAVYANHEEAVRFLISRGANKTASGCIPGNAPAGESEMNLGITPAYFASKNGTSAIKDIFCQENVKVESKPTLTP